MKKEIVVKFAIDWENYDDVCNELIMEDALPNNLITNGVTYEVISNPIDKNTLFPIAKEENAKNGWILDFDFIKKISDKTKTIMVGENESYHVGMEETESVLLAFRNQLFGGD